MRMLTLSMLGLYVALAHAGANAAPSLTLDRNVIDSETSQWLAPRRRSSRPNACN